MTRACFFFFSASRKSSEPRWLTLEGFSSQDCSGGGGAWGLQTNYRKEQLLLPGKKITPIRTENTTSVQQNTSYRIHVNEHHLISTLIFRFFQSVPAWVLVSKVHLILLFDLNRQYRKQTRCLVPCVTHLCMNSMILSLLRSCGSVYFSSPFSKYFRVGKPEILKRSPTALCTVASNAANTPGLCGRVTTQGPD